MLLEVRGPSGWCCGAGAGAGRRLCSLAGALEARSQKQGFPLVSGILPMSPLWRKLDSQLLHGDEQLPRGLCTDKEAFSGLSLFMLKKSPPFSIHTKPLPPGSPPGWPLWTQPHLV